MDDVVLRDVSQGGAEGVEVRVDVDRVELHRAAVRGSNPTERLEQCRLARAAAPGDTHHLAGLDAQRHVAEDGHCPNAARQSPRVDAYTRFRLHRRCRIRRRSFLLETRTPCPHHCWPTTGTREAQSARILLRYGEKSFSGKTRSASTCPESNGSANTPQPRTYS